MQALLARLRNEPALLGAVASILGTLGVTVPVGDGWAGLGLAVGEFVVGLVVRHFVSPVVAKPVVVPPPG